MFDEPAPYFKLVMEAAELSVSRKPSFAVSLSDDAQ
jgi:hypothetical protein